MPAMALTIAVNRAKNQYSERRARPWKSAYFRWRQVLMASWNDMRGPS
jgi:hypothetical protein